MIKILKAILKRKKYKIAAFLSFVAMAAVSYYLTVEKVYQNSIIVYSELNGLFFTTISILAGLVTSVLFGFYAALFIFRHDISRSRDSAREKAGGVAGATINIIASGCPTCGMPILGLLGFPFAVLALPLKGLELKFLSVVILLFAIRSLSENIKKSLVCTSKTS